LSSLFFSLNRGQQGLVFFPYTTFFRSGGGLRIAFVAPLVTRIREPQAGGSQALLADLAAGLTSRGHVVDVYAAREPSRKVGEQRSEEHTSELQSRGHLVCRLLLEKKKK